MYTQLCTSLWITHLVVSRSEALHSQAPLFHSNPGVIDSYPQTYEHLNNSTNCVNDLGYLVVHVTTLVHPLGNPAVGIHHRGVVAISENLANLR